MADNKRYGLVLGGKSISDSELKSAPANIYNIVTQDNLSIKQASYGTAKTLEWQVATIEKDEYQPLQVELDTAIDQRDNIQDSLTELLAQLPELKAQYDAEPAPDPNAFKDEWNEVISDCKTDKNKDVFENIWTIIYNWISNGNIVFDSVALLAAVIILVFTAGAGVKVTISLVTRVIKNFCSRCLSKEQAKVAARKAARDAYTGTTAEINELNTRLATAEKIISEKQEAVKNVYNKILELKILIAELYASAGEIYDTEEGAVYEDIDFKAAEDTTHTTYDPAFVKYYSPTKASMWKMVDGNISTAFATSILQYGVMRNRNINISIDSTNTNKITSVELLDPTLPTRADQRITDGQIYKGIQVKKVTVNN